ncbi:hypothetical protein AUJ69_02180 [Candidatus Woesearchaeota archaeon CG1_02_47_18]|nr:MAG: hypothetical protein AUJ69_02180 [Candidatus Woesearchaeota archaeon CG1_02_47_18]
MKNREVAQLLYEIADILELQGINFKPRAYRRAAQSVEGLAEDIEAIHKSDRLREIPGVGGGIAKKIDEFLRRGKLAYLNKIKKHIPRGMGELMAVPGLGPRRIKALSEKLGIRGIKTLREAAEKGLIRGLEGFGEKSEGEILEGITLIKSQESRMLLGYALPIAEELVDSLKGFKGLQGIEIAGSVRRMKETIGDLDILAVSNSPSKLMGFFTKLPSVKRIIARGPTKSSVLIEGNLQVDLRVVNKASFGSALQYFTGSKEHNIRLRQIAIKKGLKLSEYGLFTKKGEQVAGHDEAGVYRRLGISPMPPELREEEGEIEAAIAGRLPELIGYADSKGDFHVHSDYSDGNSSMEEIARRGKSLGYEYVCITDHSKAERIAHGINEEKLRQQIEEIKRLNKRVKGIRILSGIEVDIMRDGSLDLDERTLSRLDIVIAAVHSGFKASEEAMTRRVITAIENRNVDILAHPTGRLIGRRREYEIDMEQVIGAAQRNGICLEINADPMRMDLNDVLTRKAAHAGVKLAIGTDAHSADQMNYMRLGIGIARRGWCERASILNTLPLKKLEGYLKQCF